MYRIPETPRPISEMERAVLVRALEVCAAWPLTAKLSGTVGGLSVISTCSCGCGTVDFAHVTKDELADIVADCIAETPDGAKIGIIVFGYEEGITCLELYSMDGKPAKFPRIDSIVPYEPDGAAV